MFGAKRVPAMASAVGTVALVLASAVGDAQPSVAARAGTPGVPRLTLTFPGHGRATLQWRKPSKAGRSPITGYVVRPYVGRTPGPATVFSSSATSGVVHGLMNGRTYTFSVAARNAAGVGRASPASGTVTIGTPSPPRRVTAARRNRNALVSWLAPARSNGAPVTAYIVTPFVRGRAQRPHVSRSARRRYLVTGLRSGRRYRFTVRAVNRYGAGKPWLRSAAVTVARPVAPPPSSGGGCPASQPPSTYEGATIGVAQVLEAAYRGGFRTVAQLRAVVGIARAESGLTTKTRRWHPEFGCRAESDAIGVQGPDDVWNAGHTRQMSSDRGLWQISSHFWPQYTDAQTDNPDRAAKVVWKISRSGTDFTPWNTWPSPAQSMEPSVPTVEAFLARH